MNDCNNFSKLTFYYSNIKISRYHLVVQFIHTSNLLNVKIKLKFTVSTRNRKYTEIKIKSTQKKEKSDAGVSVFTAMLYIFYCGTKD